MFRFYRDFHSAVCFCFFSSREARNRKHTYIATVEEK